MNQKEFGKWSPDLCHQIMMSLPDGVTITDLTGKILAVSQKVLEFHGCENESEIIGTLITDWFAPESLKKAVANIGNLLKGAVNTDNEYLLRKKDGTSIFTAINFSVLQDERGAANGMIFTTRDISEKKEILEKIRLVDERLIRLNRIYAVLSTFRSTISRTDDVQEMFSHACTIAVKSGGFRMAWIGMLVPSTGMIEVRAHAGVARQYLDKLKISLQNRERSKGPTGVAITTGHYKVCNDIEQDPDMKPWRKDALRTDFRSSGSFPLKIKRNVIGVINLYAPESDFFTEDEIHLLNELAADISFVLENLRHKEEQKLTEEAFRKKSEELDRYFENSLDLLCIADIDGFFRRLNPEWEKTLGYPVDDLIGKQFLDFVHPDDLGPTKEAIAALAMQKEVLNFANRYRCKNGDYKWIEWRSYPEGDIIFAVARDITGRKLAEKQLREINEELQTINKVILNTAGGLDLKTKLGIILDEALSVVGLEGGTICLINPDDTFDLAAHRETSRETIDDLSTHKIKIGDCLCGNCAKECKPLILNTREEVLHYATREVLRGEDIRFHAAFPFVVAETCVGVLCVFTRTDKKPGERSLKLLETIVTQTAVSIQNARLWAEVKTHEETLDSIYKTVGDVIFQLAVEPGNIFRFISVNPAFCKVTGLNQAQIVGKTVNEIIPEPSLTMVLKNYREAILKNTFVRWEETSDYPTGRLTGEVTIAPLFDDQGKCTHLVGSVHDITGRKQAEEKILDQLNELQRWQKVMIGREERNIELKHEVNDLLKQLGKPEKYESWRE